MNDKRGDIARKYRRKLAIDDAIFILFIGGAIWTSAAVLDFCWRLIVLSWRFDTMLGVGVAGVLMMAAAWAAWEIRDLFRKHRKTE